MNALTASQDAMETLENTAAPLVMQTHALNGQATIAIKDARLQMGLQTA